MIFKSNIYNCLAYTKRLAKNIYVLFWEGGKYAKINCVKKTNNSLSIFKVIRNMEILKNTKYHVKRLKK